MRIPPTSNISIDHDRQSSTAQASYCNSICRAKFFRFTKSLFIQYSKSKHRKSLGALHWSGNVYFNFVLFLFRLFRMVIGLEVVDVCVYTAHKLFECLQFQDKPLIGVARARCDETYFYFVRCMSHRRIV